ncbi:hypothetical protein BJ928_101670 [Rhizobium sp. WW_1]|jgi:hypothetical protein|nr:hypothetical protein BJ928_101670 [Rhizobium sp. WW_1]
MVNKFLPPVVESSHSTAAKCIRTWPETQWKQRYESIPPRMNAAAGEVKIFSGISYCDEDSCAMESSVSALMPTPEDEPVRMESAGDVEDVVLFSISYIAENRCSS